MSPEALVVEKTSPKVPSPIFTHCFIRWGSIHSSHGRGRCWPHSAYTFSASDRSASSHWDRREEVTHKDRQKIRIKCNNLFSQTQSVWYKLEKHLMLLCISVCTLLCDSTWTFHKPLDRMCALMTVMVAYVHSYRRTETQQLWPEAFGERGPKGCGKEILADIS